MIKKKIMKKVVQSKKEYKTPVIQKKVEVKKKEAISNPDSPVSVCLTRGQIFAIKQKMVNDQNIQDLFTRVLEQPLITG